MINDDLPLDQLIVQQLAGDLWPTGESEQQAGDLLTATSLASPLHRHPGHFPARAKRLSFLFMHGGPSHVDTFDYKPLLEKHNGQPLPFEKPRIQFAQTGALLSSPWKFQQNGQSGT